MMAQGGFSRDYARAARIRQEAQARKEKEERGLIGDEVIVKLNPYFENKINKMEKGLILKQDETIEEFIKITRDRNRLLKFLLWTNALTLLGLSFVLGYFL